MPYFVIIPPNVLGVDTSTMILYRIPHVPNDFSIWLEKKTQTKAKNIPNGYFSVCIFEYIWVLIKIKVSGAATIADQPRINRDPNGVNPTPFWAENRRHIATSHSI